MTLYQNQTVRKPVSIAIGDKIVAMVEVAHKMRVPIDCRVAGYKTIANRRLVRVHWIAKNREILIQWNQIVRNRGKVS